MTPLRSRDLNYQEDIEQFDVNAMKVQNCAAVTMTISPPKKMKLPALADIERISQNKGIGKLMAKCLMSNFFVSRHCKETGLLF